MIAPDARRRVASGTRPLWSAPLNTSFPKILFAAGLVAGGLAFGAPRAFAGPNDLETFVPRPQRAVDDKRVERVDDELGDAAERVRAEHARLLADPANVGKSPVDVDTVLCEARTERKLDRPGDVHEAVLAGSARRDAHLARLVDHKGDREERSRAEEKRLEQQILAFKNGKFPKTTPDIVRNSANEDALKTDDQRREQKKSGQQDKLDQHREHMDEQRLDAEGFRHDRLDDRTERQQDRAQDRKDDRKDDRKTERDERLKDAKDEKAKDRADDRKERRDEIRQEQSDERTAAKPGAGAAAAAAGP